MIVGVSWFCLLGAMEGGWGGGGGGGGGVYVCVTLGSVQKC